VRLRGGVVISWVGSVRARRVEVTAQTPGVDTAAGSAYAAAWEVTTPGGDARSAEQWARTAFEDAPRAIRAFIVAGWTVGLGLQLGPRPSADHVLGWQIVSAAPDRIVLRVRSVLLGTGHLALQVERSRVVLASFVRYERRGARTIWAAVQPLHHLILPYLFGHAASHLTSGRP
jgi:hypothetical protein